MSRASNAVPVSRARRRAEGKGEGAEGSAGLPRAGGLHELRLHHDAVLRPRTACGRASDVRASWQARARRCGDGTQSGSAPVAPSQRLGVGVVRRGIGAGPPRDLPHESAPRMLSISQAHAATSWPGRRCSLRIATHLLHSFYNCFCKQLWRRSIYKDRGHLFALRSGRYLAAVGTRGATARARAALAALTAAAARFAASPGARPLSAFAHVLPLSDGPLCLRQPEACKNRRRYEHAHAECAFEETDMPSAISLKRVVAKPHPSLRKSIHKVL